MLNCAHMYVILYLKTLLESSLAMCKCWAPVLSCVSWTDTKNSSGTDKTYGGIAKMTNEQSITKKAWKHQLPVDLSPWINLYSAQWYWFPLITLIQWEKNNLIFVKTKKIWTIHVPEHNFYYTQVYIWLYIDEASIIMYKFFKIKVKVERDIY